MANDVTIYTTGDKQHGLGHVVRMRLLAWLLVERGLSVGFASERDTPGWEILAQTGLPVNSFWHGGTVVIIDVENGPTLDVLDTARDLFGKLVTISGNGYPVNEPAAIEQLSDLVVCQSIFECARPAHVLQGARYIIIDPRYAKNKTDPDGPMVVCMGGTDPHDLTPRVKHALNYPWDHRRVLFPHNEPTLVPFFWGASKFIGAQGMVAFEAIAAGLPCILYSWSEDHVKTVAELERQGLVLNMGLWSNFDERELKKVVDLGYWQVKNTGPRLIDGLGAGRVADAICKLM